MNASGRWYNQIQEAVKIQQNRDIWMSETRVSYEERKPLKIYMWPSTTKGTSCLLLKKLKFFALSNWRFYKLSNDPKFVFPFNFSIFYTLFCSLSKNKLGRQDVSFVVMGHIYNIQSKFCLIEKDHGINASICVLSSR